MTVKAIDIVLLPSGQITEMAVQINRQLVEQFGLKIVLDKENCLPHISLAMGSIDEKDLPAIEKILRKIIEPEAVKNLKAIGISEGTITSGQVISAIEIKKTNELAGFHEKIMTNCQEYLSPNISDDMLYGDERIGESTLLWIKNYRSQSSFEKFYPHITLGYGSIGRNIDFPIRFEVCSLALCHLGNHCTCREILAEIKF